MRKIKWPEKVNNEAVFGHMYKREVETSKQYPAQRSQLDRTYSKNKLSFYDAIEGQVTEVKRVVRRTLLLDDLRNRRRFWELKEETEDKKR